MKLFMNEIEVAAMEATMMNEFEVATMEATMMNEFEEVEMMDNLIHEAFKRKAIRAQRRKLARKAKKLQRKRAGVDQAFLEMPKEEQRKRLHRSVYRRTQSDHAEMMWANQERAERRRKIDSAELVYLKKTYLGAWTPEELNLLPTHICYLAEELAGCTEYTVDEILRCKQTFVYLTGVFHPERLDEVCEFADVA